MLHTYTHTLTHTNPGSLTGGSRRTLEKKSRRGRRLSRSQGGRKGEAVAARRGAVRCALCSVCFSFDVWTRRGRGAKGLRASSFSTSVAFRSKTKKKASSTVESKEGGKKVRLPDLLPPPSTPGVTRQRERGERGEKDQTDT